MIKSLKHIISYRELLFALTWKDLIVRYKQAYLGIAWTILKPTMLMLIFALVRSFVGIETGDIPYPILTFTALLPWIFFQDSTTDGINSVTANAMLVRKIYFPREIFPLASTLTKLAEFAVNFVILSILIIYYQIDLSLNILWLPLLIFYTALVSLSVSLLGAAINVFYRDIGAVLPVALSLLMYACPIIYPLSLVQKTLLLQQKAGTFSSLLFNIYTMNPLTGIIDSFQRVILMGKQPDLNILWPGFLLIALLFPVSYVVFKKAEPRFADVI